MLVLVAAFVLLVVALSVVRLIVSIFALLIGRLLVWVLLLLMPARVTLIVGIAVVPVPLVLKLIVLPFFIIIRSIVSLVAIEVRICRHGRVIFVELVLPLALMIEIFFRIISLVFMVFVSLVPTALVLISALRHIFWKIPLVLRISCEVIWP